MKFEERSEELRTDNVDHARAHKIATNNIEADNVDVATKNPDPITGEPGSHPLGTGIGAATTGAVATAIGATVGPVGAVVGAVVGSVIGGLVGKSAAEATNPSIEADYWQRSYAQRPYARSDRSYEAYQLAYQVGYEGYVNHADARVTYREIEPTLQQEYEGRNDGSSVNWNDAKHAVEDAWQRARRNDFFYQEDLYWRENYQNQPYYNPNLIYQDYQPAYRVGYEGYTKYADSNQTTEEIELGLQQDYEATSAGLAWEQAKPAIYDAWMRAKQRFGQFNR